MRLLTVATANYLHLVDVLFNSARRVHPELRLTVILADCSPNVLGQIRDVLGPEVDVLCCADLGFDFLDDMRTYYTALEFCSALKVLGSSYILQKEEGCLFLDPDMLVQDSLREAVLEQQGEIVACCHTFSPFPQDDDSPNDLELCWVGQLNGGVLLSRRGPQGTPAIDWLVEKTKYNWFVAPERGMYADQQWLSALPYFFRDRTTVVSDRGVNVAYWNLHERLLRRSVPRGAVTLMAGGPLRLMHFSGFKMASGGRLTQHSSRKFDAETEVILADMVAEYERNLSVAHERLRHLTGDLGFSNLPLTKRMQQAAQRWNVPELAPPKSMPHQLRRVLRSVLGRINP